MRHISDIRRNVVMAVMMLAVVMVRAQSFNHDASVMNQFTIGETGVGSFTPDLYYDLLHKNYRNGAMMTNKQFFRTQLQLVLNGREEGHAEALDSALTDRMRVEVKNMADRSPGVTDVAWQVERGKIESKLAMFKKNIERLTLEGASGSVYRQWLERYNCINCGLGALRDAYMPQGRRKEQYIAIYKDILLQNTEVCEFINYLRLQRMIGLDSMKAHPLPKSQMGMLARVAHGRWKVALSECSGNSN